ncbi:MAG: MBL fold metallo-hydrolase [candidate division Zixibacteria bacterium]|nr:MBL fold metallo-hydrolase [candidate division Zixibacteria bacterium]
MADEKTKEAWIIDPGAEGNRIRSEIQRLGLKPSKIILTHAHGDHIGAVEELRQFYKIPVFIHEKDHPLLISPEENLSAAFGMPISAGKAEEFLVEGGRLNLGELNFEVIETPGHTPGGITLYGEKAAFTGDALFAGSIGRYDFPHSDGELLFQSLQKLMKLPDDTVVYSGHGPATTIGRERKMNPFLLDLD